MRVRSTPGFFADQTCLDGHSVSIRPGASDPTQ